MLPGVRGITFSGEITDLGNPLGVVLERDSIPDVEGCPLRAASGAEVPVIAVASLNSGVSPPAIRRTDGRCVVTVAANPDPALISGDEAGGILASSILADLTALYPNPTCTFGSEQRRKLRPLDSLYRRFAIAPIMIFALLATPLVPERAIQARFPVHFAASPGCGILVVTAIIMIVVYARSTIHLPLIASRGGSGVRTAPRLQMQGGHG